MSKNKTREAIYLCICDYRKSFGYSPSFREIAKITGVSLSTVTYHLIKLREESRIRYDSKISRSIVPLVNES